MKFNTIPKLSVAVAAIILASGTVASAADNVPAATLLIPYFAVDLNVANVDDSIALLSFSQEVRRNPKTGELTHLLKIKRIVDEHSPALVQAFLDGTVIPELKIAVATPDGRTTSSEGFVSFRTLTPVSYSMTTGGEDDGIEVLTYTHSALGLFSVGLPA